MRNSKQFQVMINTQTDAKMQSKCIYRPLPKYIKKKKQNSPISFDIDWSIGSCAQPLAHKIPYNLLTNKQIINYIFHWEMKLILTVKRARARDWYLENVINKTTSAKPRLWSTLNIRFNLVTTSYGWALSISAVPSIVRCPKS